MTTVEVAAGQGPAGSLVVNVSVTVPLAILGVYVDVSELALENVPLGADQVEEVALPPIVPASVIVPPAQTVCTAPAFAVGAWLTVITTVEVTAVHGPAPSGSLVANVSVTVPLAMLGVYVDVSELALENVPLGADRSEEVALPPIIPASVIVPPAQTVCTAPAFAVGAWLTVITTVEVAAVHGPAPSGSLVVKVSVTVPLAILGVYVDVSELALENVPLGADQVEEVALPPIVPASVIVPPAQTVCTAPAFAVGAWLTVNVL